MDTSPDGRLFWAIDKGGIKMFNVDTCSPLFLHPISEEDRRGAWPAFSPDGQHFAIAQGRKVDVRKLTNGEKQKEFFLSKKPRRVYLRPEMDLLLSVDSDRVAHGWSLSTGKELYTFSHTGFTKETSLNTNASNSDSKNKKLEQNYGVSKKRSNGASLIALSYKDDGIFPFGKEAKIQITEKRNEQSKSSEIKIWDAKTGEQMGSFMIHDAKTTNKFTLNSDETLLAVALYGGDAGLWDLKTCKQLSRIKIDGTIERFLFSPNNRWLGISTNDNRLYIWDIIVKSMSSVFTHTDGLDQFLFTKEGSRVVTSSNEGLVRLWEIGEPKIQIRKMIHEHGKRVDKMVITPNGNFLATQFSYTDINYVTVWDLATGKERYRIYHVEQDRPSTQKRLKHLENKKDEHEHSNNYIRDIAISPDGSIFATAGAEGTVKLWHCEDGRKIIQLAYDHEWPEINFSSDGKRLAINTTRREEVAGYERRRDFIAIWSTGGDFKKISEISGYFSRYRFSPDGNMLITAEGEEERRISQFHPKTYEEENIRPVRDPQAFWGVRIWDSNTGKEILRIPYQVPIRNAVFNKKGDMFVVSSWAVKTLDIYHTASGKPIANIEYSDESAVREIQFSDSGKFMVTRHAHPSKIMVWDTTTWRTKSILYDPSASWGLQFSPDERNLMWKDEGKIWLWDWDADRKVAAISSGGSYGRFLFSPDEKHIIAADDSGHVNVFQWRPEDLVADACRRLEHNLSKKDWQTYFGNEPYRATCPGLPMPAN